MVLKSGQVVAFKSKHNVCNSDSRAPTFAPMESLKERRLRIVGTQKELAAVCDCDHTHISHIECGRCDPSLEVFVKMLDALDVSAKKMLEMLKMRSASGSVTDIQKARAARKRR